MAGDSPWEHSGLSLPSPWEQVCTEIMWTASRACLPGWRRSSLGQMWDDQDKPLAADPCAYGLHDAALHQKQEPKQQHHPAILLLKQDRTLIPLCSSVTSVKDAQKLPWLYFSLDPGCSRCGPTVSSTDKQNTERTSLQRAA